VYSVSKAAVEVIAKSFADRGRLEVLAIRPTHIVFPTEYPELEARGADVDNYHLWGYVAPEDVARAFRLALEVADGAYDCFFIAAPDGLNRRPTLEMLHERLGFVPEVRDPGLFARLPTAGVIGAEHAREKLGFTTRIARDDFTIPDGSLSE